MTEMQAVGFTEFGDPSVIKIVTVPIPSPGPGQVRVRVAAATVNPTDVGFRLGGRHLPDGVTPPYIAGMDLAGVIDAAGPEVSDWHAGDRVMAAVSPWVPGGGAQAEYVVVSEDQLARVPDGMSLEAAATLPMNSMTVRTALDILGLSAGQTLAVTGSAGAVGQYAIQLGTHDGLVVIGDAKPEDEELIRSFGAAHVVERGAGMAAAVRELYPSGVDAVLDAALLGPAVLPAVRDGGQLLAVRPFQGETERDIKISLVLVGQHLHEGGRLAELADLADKGVITLRIADLIPADHAAEAHRRLEAGGVRGRLVLVFLPGPLDAAAAAWDAEYAAGRYAAEPPVPFTGDILAAARRSGLTRGLYIGCGNGRNYLPLVAGGLDLTGLDISAAAITQLTARAPEHGMRLVHGDLRALPASAAYQVVIGIQVFQHGDRAAAHAHIVAAARRVAPGGLFCLRVNAGVTDVWPAHEVTERHPDGDFTVRYLAGPKRGLLIHFFSGAELDALFAEEFAVVLRPRLDVVRRDPPQPGQWSQWEAIWRRTT